MLYKWENNDEIRGIKRKHYWKIKKIKQKELQTHTHLKKIAIFNNNKILKKRNKKKTIYESIL